MVAGGPLGGRPRNGGVLLDDAVCEREGGEIEVEEVAPPFQELKLAALLIQGGKLLPGKRRTKEFEGILVGNIRKYCMSS